MLKMKVMSLFHNSNYATRVESQNRTLKNDQPRRFLRSVPAQIR